MAIYHTVSFLAEAGKATERTVRPLDRVVDCVRAGVTGLAYLRNGATELRALLTRVAFRKLYASLCDAIVKGVEREGVW